MNTLERLHKLEAEATPGPWRYSKGYEPRNADIVAGYDHNVIIHRDNVVEGAAAFENS